LAQVLVSHLGRVDPRRGDRAAARRR
jgi:hypothetical protein